MGKLENFILEHLKVIRPDIAGMRDDIREIGQPLSNVENGIASLKRDTADFVHIDLCNAGYVNHNLAKEISKSGYQAPGLETQISPYMY